MIYVNADAMLNAQFQKYLLFTMAVYPKFLHTMTDLAVDFSLRRTGLWADAACEEEVLEWFDLFAFLPKLGTLRLIICDPKECLDSPEVRFITGVMQSLETVRGIRASVRKERGDFTWREVLANGQIHHEKYVDEKTTILWTVDDSDGLVKKLWNADNWSAE